MVATAAPDGQISRRDKKLSSPISKNISLSPSGKSVLPARPVLSRQEGRFAVVTNAGWDAVDAAALARKWSSQGRFSVSEQPARRRTALQRLRQNSADSTWSVESFGGGRCVRRSRVVLASVADAKPCGGDVIPTGFDAPSIRLATVTKRNSSPRRARRKPLKPLRGESRVISGGTRGDYRVLTTNAHGLRVLRAPGFPCSLFSIEGRCPFKPRANHAARMRRYTLSAVAFCCGELPLANFDWTPLMSGSSPRRIAHQTGRQSLGGQNVAPLRRNKFAKHPLLNGQWQSGRLLCNGAAGIQALEPSCSRSARIRWRKHA